MTLKNTEKVESTVNPRIKAQIREEILEEKLRGNLGYSEAYIIRECLAKRYGEEL